MKSKPEENKAPIANLTIPEPLKNKVNNNTSGLCTFKVTPILNKVMKNLMPLTL